MIDYEKTIISQYANSPTICKLIENMNAYIDPSANFQAFYDFVWNVDTAEGFGLDIWGRIVGVARDLQVPSIGAYFGFDTTNQDFTPFNVAPFRTSDSLLNETYALADHAYRALIMAKALANISIATIPATNQMLQKLFPGRGRCYCEDLGNMAMNLVFEFVLQPYEVAIVATSGIINRPAGVVLTYEINV